METIGKIAAVLAMIASICTITGVSIWGVVSFVRDKNNDNIEVQSLTDEDSSEDNTQEGSSSLSEEMEEYFAGIDNTPNIDLCNEKESENYSLKETEEHSENIEVFSGIDIQSNNNVIEKINVEEEIKEIKKQYYKVQNQKDTFTQHPVSNKIKIYYVTDKVVSVEVSSGYNDIGYSRIYYYDDNGKLYFAFVFDKKKENRLYFKDNILIRYIDESGDIYDLYENLETCSWFEFVLSESYELLENIN